MERHTVWITGAGGLIGSQLVQSASRWAPAVRVLPILRDRCDLTDRHAVERCFAEDSPDLVIHCAGLTRSPLCQSDPALARRLNVEMTGCLAEVAAARRLIFLSTDLVFDGRRGMYRETDPPNPLNVYAETKVEAEERVLAHPRHVVVRTSLNFGESPTGDRAFNEEMAKAWRAGKTLSCFTDEYRSVIPVESTARALWVLARWWLDEPAGDHHRIFHLAGAERLSRWQIAQWVAAQYPECRPKLEPGSLRDYQGGPRPADTSLDIARIQKLLDFSLPRFSEWVRDRLAQRSKDTSVAPGA
ncbi:MAG: SDR family oxidoreductase [Verrucomicrobiales bacterium]|nr:SDR family oxidoreductase [Verrucomicrobiales bacterium]